MADPSSEQGVTEMLVREAVSAGMESPYRETILEGVEESEPMPVEPARRVPAALLLVGVAFAVGYLLGRRSSQQSGW